MKRIVAPSLVVLLFCGMALAVWWGAAQFRDKTLTVNEDARCGSQVARTLADREGLLPLRSCTANEYTLDDGERITVIEIAYGNGNEQGGKFFFVDSLSGKVIKAYDNRYGYPDFSLGSNNTACSYIWTNDVGSLVQADPEHIKRALVKEGNEYRWKLELTNFSGHHPGDPAPRECLRSGVLTTHLDGTDATMLTPPSFDIK